MKNSMLQPITKLSTLLLIFLTLPSSAYAAGALDQTFGGGGRTVIEIGAQSSVSATIVQPDGKIIIVGEASFTGKGADTVIVRLNPNGTLDSGFGSGGKVIVSLSPLYDVVRAVALAPDGKIIIAGGKVAATGQMDFLVARFTTAGNLDTSFGDNGVVTVNQGSYDVFYAVAVQPDGKIVAAGSTTDGDRAAVIRFNPNGALDTTFANGGLFYWSYGIYSFESVFRALALLPNGRILLGGQDRPFHSNSNDILALLEPNGAFAQDFGNGGFFLEYSENQSPGFEVSVLPDGKFLVLSKAGFRRYFSNGARDQSFRAQYSNNCCFPSDMGTDFAIRSDGRILVLNQGNYARTDIVAYNNDGREINRVKNLPADDIVVQNDNKFVIGGASGNSFVVTRFVSITSPATRLADFDYDGKTDLIVSRLGETIYVLRSALNVTSYSLHRAAGEGVRIIPEDYYSNDPSQFPLFYWRYSGQNAPGYFEGVTEWGNVTTYQWGISGDIPVGGDYDGETIQFNSSLFRKSTELTIYRPSDGTWWVYNRSNSTYFAVRWGISGDKPVPADYDYDGITDMAVYRPSTGTWWIRYSSNGESLAIRFGISTDIPLTGDFDGDGRADFTVYRASEGNWYQLLTTEGFRVVRFGLSTDVPVPGDYDGDGRHDVAIFRDGFWYLLQSTEGFKVIQWGISSDDPIPVRYDR